MTHIQFTHTYDDIISIQNLLEAWEEFLRGKKHKKDVYEFSLNLMENILDLQNDLLHKRYVHGGYVAFTISDPKTRNIHKASVRDRLLHHALYRTMYPFFDKTFFSESYSCRVGKGTHKAINKFRAFTFEESKNNHRTLWVLKCDIRKFFASVDQKILLKILKKYITDSDTLWLLRQVVSSFNSGEENTGLPLGNLTSQLLVNIYMNEFDQWMKHVMKTIHYIRYADDFVILSGDKDYLLELTSKIADFLEEELALTLHPDKLFIKTFASGIDFLGWIHFPTHRVLRTSTKRRAKRTLLESENICKLYSYRGLMMHGNQYILKNRIDIKIKSLLKNSV